MESRGGGGWAWVGGDGVGGRKSGRGGGALFVWSVIMLYFEIERQCSQRVLWV